MFAGLTSRCTSPAPCAASSADATGDKNSKARPGGSAPSLSSTFRRSPPSTNRIAMNSTPSASPASYTGMMYGSSAAAAARDSAMNCRRNDPSVANAGARIFSATSRSSRWSRARNTAAIPPAPTWASSRYPASSEPARNPASAGKSSLNPPTTFAATAALPLQACRWHRRCAAQAIQVSGLSFSRRNPEQPGESAGRLTPATLRTAGLR
jgi:hypothetical protein